MIRSFRKNPYYLAHYHRGWTIALAAVNLALLFFKTPSLEVSLLYLPALLLLTSIRVEYVIAGALYGVAASALSSQFEWSQLSLVPLAIILGFCFSGLIHCASHGSVRPRWLNRALGEFLGLAQLSGFADWKIIHVIHHQFPDDPERDPHAPMNKGYWHYTKSMRDSILKGFLNSYMELHKGNPEAPAALKSFGKWSRADQKAKVLFWFLLLGPQTFSFLFAVSIVSKMFQFSWLNWAAHRPAASGKTEIHNLTGPLYWLPNLFSFGLYIHGNHHLDPSLFHPGSYKGEARPSARSFDQAS